MDNCNQFDPGQDIATPRGLEVSCCRSCKMLPHLWLKSMSQVFSHVHLTNSRIKKNCSLNEHFSNFWETAFSSLIPGYEEDPFQWRRKLCSSKGFHPGQSGSFGQFLCFPMVIVWHKDCEVGYRTMCIWIVNRLFKCLFDWLNRTLNLIHLRTACTDHL